MREFRLPIKGASDVPPYEKSGEGFAPLEAVENIEVFPAPGNRAQIGTRRGHERVFERQLGNGRVQGLVAGTRNPAVAGYVLAKGEEIGGGTSKAAGAFSGNFWLADDVPSLYRERTYQPGVSTGPIPAVKWNAEGTRFAVAFNNVDTDGVIRGYVRWCDAEGETMWSKQLKGPAAVEATYPTYVNNLAVSANYVWATAGLGIHRLSRADGTLQTFYPGWANQVIAVWVYDDGETEYLYVATNGSEAPATMSGGQLINAGVPASMTRSGIQKFIIPAAAASNPQRVAFGYGLTSGDPFFEANHGMLRMSEDPSRAPYGCNMNAMCANEFGIYFARSNQGWGPGTWEHRPLGTTLPHAVVGMADHDGYIIWLADHDSLDASGMGYGYYEDPPGTPQYHFNDIATPTYQAIAADANGDLYIGGRQNKAGFAVLKLSGTDGRMLWRKNLFASGGLVPENGLCVNPTTQNLMVVGTRNTAWGSGAQAMLWELSRVDGEILNGFDIEKAVSGQAIDVSASGRIVFGTEYAA